MIVKNYIESTIDELEKMYNSSNNQKQLIYYSKLALMELCGWVEGSMDDIVEKYCNRKLRDRRNKTYAKKKIIRPNYGFQYDDNFRPMLMKAIGIVAIEQLERKLEDSGGKITVLRSKLGDLKNPRNDAAHTFIKGTMTTFFAPSTIKGEFNILYPILKEIESEIRNM